MALLAGRDVLVDDRVERLRLERQALVVVRLKCVVNLPCLRNGIIQLPRAKASPNIDLIQQTTSVINLVALVDDKLPVVEVTCPLHPLKSLLCSGNLESRVQGALSRVCLGVSHYELLSRLCLGKNVTR